MPTDIQPLGTADKTFYWIRRGTSPSTGSLELCAIDEVGKVTPTGIRAEWDPTAMSKEEAIAHHLSAAIAEADRDLERRRREAPEPESEPPPLDPATARFFSD